jgi:hypothetical protein
VKKLANIKTIAYLSGAKWSIQKKRIQAPLQAVKFPSEIVGHFATPLLGVPLYPVQYQPQGYQKAVEFVMLWWRKIQTTFYGLTIWSVMPETVPYAIARPLPDGDTKQLLKFKIRLSLLFGFPINQDNDRIKPGILIT